MSVTDGGLDGAFGAPIIPIAWSLKGGKAIAWGILKLQWRAERPVGGVCRKPRRYLEAHLRLWVFVSPTFLGWPSHLPINIIFNDMFSFYYVVKYLHLKTSPPFNQFYTWLNMGESSDWTILWSDAARVQVSEIFRRIWIAAVFQFYCHSLSVDEKNFCLSRWCPTTKILSPSNGRGGLTMPQNQSPLKWQNTTYTI